MQTGDKANDAGEFYTKWAFKIGAASLNHPVVWPSNFTLGASLDSWRMTKTGLLCTIQILENWHQMSFIYVEMDPPEYLLLVVVLSCSTVPELTDNLPHPIAKTVPYKSQDRALFPSPSAPAPRARRPNSPRRPRTTSAESSGAASCPRSPPGRAAPARSPSMSTPSSGDLELREFRISRDV